MRITERVMHDFRENGLRVDDLIINHIVKEADYAFHRQRREIRIATFTLWRRPVGVSMFRRLSSFAL